MKRRHFWSKPTLTEKLTEIVPNIDVHIIPDSLADAKYKAASESKRITVPALHDLVITVLTLALATAIGSLFDGVGFTEANIITVYYLGVLLVSLFTGSQICSVISSLGSVLLFNFFFTDPKMTFHAYEQGYPVTLIIMLVVSVVTATLANKLKDHAKQSSRSAFRTKVLFDTSQLLQKAKTDKEILDITAAQLMKLLGRDIIVYPEENGKLSSGYALTVLPEMDTASLFTVNERTAAEWAYQNKHHAGASTNTYKDAACMYLAIRINHKVFGVVGIHIGTKPLDSFENSFLLSVLGECALAIENHRNAKEKEQAAVFAKNEQLRANLLRTISHDLRTPLTSISGNAGNLLSNWEQMNEGERVQALTDITDDSEWLISLVENLLSVTRIEEGRMNFNMSVQLMDEVIDESLKHINRKSSEHHISVKYSDELLLVRVDARLIMQVVINIVDNAIKYTPIGSEIKLTAKKIGEFVAVSIADNGAGMPDEMKAHVFDMFYTGNNTIGDSRRSLGLGLFLCRSIINAHGGELTLLDNTPHGCIFTFTLPAGEVNINE